MLVLSSEEGRDWVEMETDVTPLVLTRSITTGLSTLSRFYPHRGCSWLTVSLKSTARREDHHAPWWWRRAVRLTPRMR